MTDDEIVEKSKRHMAKKLPDFISEDVAARFWGQVNMRGKNDCWHWGSVAQQYYAQFRIDGVSYRATHVAIFLSRGERVTGDLVVCHTCDNPPCVNPAHLFIATVAENNADRQRKGRTKYPHIPAHVKPRGSQHALAKLDEASASEIKERLRHGESQYRIADRFGVHQSTISLIKNGRMWAHVE